MRETDSERLSDVKKNPNIKKQRSHTRAKEEAQGVIAWMNGGTRERHFILTEDYQGSLFGGGHIRMTMSFPWTL